MRTINHQLFLTENGLDKTTLLQELQKKIAIFDRMYAKWEQTVEEDRSELKAKLQQLDQEIYQDMLDTFEDALANNDELEETDEDILEQLWRMKRTKGLSRSALKKYGIKRNLSGWNIPVGKYILRRTEIFSYTYNLERRKN